MLAKNIGDASVYGSFRASGCRIAASWVGEKDWYNPVDFPVNDSSSLAAKHDDQFYALTSDARYFPRRKVFFNNLESFSTRLPAKLSTPAI